MSGFDFAELFCLIKLKQKRIKCYQVTFDRFIASFKPQMHMNSSKIRAILSHLLHESVHSGCYTLYCEPTPPLSVCTVDITLLYVALMMKVR